MNRLSQNFSLEEATRSEKASRLGLDNTPTMQVIENMRNTAEGMEQVRKALNNKPIIVSSWYRSQAVNDAVGSKPTSQHVLGQAVDFICPAFGTVDAIINAIRMSEIKFDQLIKEFVNPETGQGGWVHISFNAAPRRQILVIDGKGARKYV